MRLERPEFNYGDGQPMLLPYQTAWVKEEARFAVCEKGRRIGLSWADALERVLYTATGQGNIFYQSYNKDMTETYIRDCADWASKLDLAIAGVVEETIISNEREQIHRFRIDFDSEKSIIALSSNPRVLRSKGKPGDMVILDEAAFCDDLAELLKAATAVAQWGGKVRIISTHNGDDNPFNELIKDIRAGRHPQYALHRITLDDAVDAGLARRVCAVTGRPWRDGAAQAWRDDIVAGYPTHDDAEEELFCVPKRGGATYFPRALVESRMNADAPVLRFNGDERFNAMTEPARRAELDDWLEENILPLLEALTLECRHAVGMDFARKTHLSVIAPLEIDAAINYICPFLFEMQNVPHPQQLQALTFIIAALPRFAGGAIDATGNGSFIAEAAVDAFGSIIDPAMITESWYRDFIPKYKARFEDATLTIPKNDDLLQDHRAFRLERGVPRLPNKTDKRGNRHGDAAIALALACQAAAADIVPIEFESAGPRATVEAGDAFLNQIGAGGGHGMYAGF